MTKRKFVFRMNATAGNGTTEMKEENIAEGIKKKKKKKKKKNNTHQIFGEIFKIKSYLNTLCGPLCDLFLKSAVGFYQRENFLRPPDPYVSFSHWLRRAGNIIIIVWYTNDPSQHTNMRDF